MFCVSCSTLSCFPEPTKCCRSENSSPSHASPRHGSIRYLWMNAVVRFHLILPRMSAALPHSPVPHFHHSQPDTHERNQFHSLLLPSPSPSPIITSLPPKLNPPNASPAAYSSTMNLISRYCTLSGPNVASALRKEDCSYSTLSISYVL